MRICTPLKILFLSALLFTVGFMQLVDVSLIWNVDPVDTTAAGIGSGYCPITTDRNDKPHIAYTGHSPPNIYDIVRYASWNGSSWSIQEVSKGTAVDLALDSKGNPHILYTASGNLMYAHWIGSNWTKQTLAEGHIVHASFALDSSDNPQVIYSVGEDLVYACWAGANWTKQTIDSSDVGFQCSLALDSNDNPYVLYFNQSSYTDDTRVYSLVCVKLAVLKNSVWSIEPVLESLNLNGCGNIVLDPKNQPHFLCTKPQTSTPFSTFVYASWNGSLWNAQEIVSDVETVNDFALGPLRLDSNGDPCLAYTNSIGKIIYASRNAQNWSFQTFNTTIRPSDVGGSCYLAVDSNGNPHISYRGLESGQFGHNATLVYAVAKTTDIRQSPNLQFALLAVLTIAIIGVTVLTVVHVLKKQLSVKRKQPH
jgi:hypothetical protein